MMESKRTAEQQFGPAAAAYAAFNYHAAGPDLAPMLSAAGLSGEERVLDIGSGPGHTALLFATRAREVVAADPTEAMLDQGRRLAAERGLSNLCFERTRAESLPFPDASFDRVTSRQSAHHYGDVRSALREVASVLKPAGQFLLIDTFSPEDDEQDDFLNRIELLRDPTHVRDYRVSEWRTMFAEVGFELADLEAWDIPLEFDDWVERSRTPETDVAQLRRCFAQASKRVLERFAVDAGCNWSVPIGLVVGRRPAR
jgi:SAM-dependent methyltransferase